jgi:1-acyl-sn-glycerol-3-phosphate acyltransferase
MLKQINLGWRIIAAGISYTTFGVLALIMSAVLLILVYPIPFSPARKQRWTRRAISTLFWFFVRLMSTLGLMSFRYQGVDKLRVQGQLIVANHPTLLDIVFLLSLVPEAMCIVKEGMFTNGFTRVVVSLAGYISNLNESLVMKAVDAIHQGQTVIVFPEGTRTRPNEALSFKRGAANIAVRAKCRVIPVLIGCNPGALRKGDKWYDMPSRPSLFTFDVMPTIVVSQCIDTERPPSIQARHLTQHLEHSYDQWLTNIGQHPQ